MTNSNPTKLQLPVLLSHLNFSPTPNMSSFLSLIFFSILISISPSQSQSLRGRFINCGATVSTTIDGREWQPDTPYISSGTPKSLNPDLVPILTTVRSFPNLTHRKFCYVIPVYRTGKYMVRTTYYYYGGINESPPVFDQIIDGTLWGVVNTTSDYAKNMSSYYEGVFVASGKTMSVCVAANTYTDSDPFISALEVVPLGGSVYNTTTFSMYGLSLVARHSFGYNGSIIRFPDDQFDRFWEPYAEENFTVGSTRNLSVSGFWNLPPAKIFETEKSSSTPEPIELQWPSGSLPNSTYYIALYFADGRDSIARSSRMFNISINGMLYYNSLHATSAGNVVFATRWPLGGLTKITLSPAPGSDIGPVINAGEIFNVLLLGRKTATRDVIVLERLKESFQGYPIDWSGDPCMPREYSWTGVTCSEGNRIRVIALNLTGMGLSGSISSGIANLTALTGIWLGNNNLSGPIPNISSLRMLETLHLDNNQLSGEIPQSLADMNSLREIFLQNNNLTGQIPSGLVGKPGLNLQTSPGNHLSAPSPL